MNKLIYIYYLLTLPTVLAVVKLNHKIFVDVEAISYLDPQIHGLLVILADNFVKTYLQESQFPTLFVTAIPVKGSQSINDRVTKVLYPEFIQEGKLIALDSMKEKSWYYACVEFESLNRHNESTGSTCRLFRTLDKFGKTADSTVTDLRVTSQRHDSLSFELNVDSDFQARYTVYLSEGGVPARVVLARGAAGGTTLRVSFDNLDPDSDYGSLCVLEEPISSPAYTTMGRLIGVYLENCYLSNLKTKSLPMADVGQPEFQRLDGSKIESGSIIDGSSINKDTSSSVNVYSVVANVVVCVAVAALMQNFYPFLM